MIERWSTDLRVQWVIRSAVALVVEPVRMLVHRRSLGRLPRRHQRLYVRPGDIPHDVSNDIPHVQRLEDLLGRVIISGDWDMVRRPLMNRAKRPSLVALANGLGPIESGYVDWMERQAAKSAPNHGCRTRTEILQRAEDLQGMIADLRSTGSLRTRRELRPWSFREKGGIQVTVGRDGAVRHAADGDHRLVFSQALDLTAIPVSIIAVHPEAVRNGSWDRLITTSKSLTSLIRHRDDGS